MRWLLLFLLVLNGVVLFWFVQQQKADTAIEPESSLVTVAGADSITLLSEVPKNKIKYKKIDDVQNAEPAPVLQPEPVAPASVEETAAVTQAAPPSTANLEEAPQVSENKKTENKKADDKAPDDRCGILGPFAEPITVRQVLGQLKRAKVDGKIYSEQIKINPIYWVYLRPATSRSEALGTLRKLHGQRIDAFIVSDGSDSNAISLGFFSAKASAEAIQRQRIEQGYDAQIVLKNRQRDQYWIVTAPQAGPLLDDKLMADVRTEYGEFIKRTRKCSVVASLHQFE